MKRKVTKVEQFLSAMDKITPWAEFVACIKPYYKKSGGRKPHDIELMLRIYFLQQWYNLSDPMMEDHIYLNLAYQAFLGFDCFGGVVPDESSICRFRHLLEQHDLTQQFLAISQDYLSQHGLVMREGTVVDATLFSAPRSKKNKAKQRDPEMSSTKKNNQWHFGAKGHIGVQANGKPIIHSVDYSTAKQHDKKSLEKLLHGDEKARYGDSGYTDQTDKKQCRKDGVFYGVIDRAARGHPLSNSQIKRNRKLSKIRAKVEHPFRTIKCVFGHTKLRYKGLAKNASQFTALCMLQNLYVCRKELLATG